MPSDYVLEQLTNLADVLPLGDVLVSRHLLLSQRVPMCQKLIDVLCCFFKDNKSINVPSVKPHPVVSIVDKLTEQLDAGVDKLIVFMERIQSSFHNCSEVLRVKPIKEQIKVLVLDKPAQYSSEYVH